MKHRTAEEQQRLNGYMRRKEVLEYALYESVQAEPATPDEVKRFLKKAPPEVPILLHGLGARNPLDGKWRVDERIVSGFVGAVLAKGRKKQETRAPDADR